MRTYAWLRLALYSSHQIYQKNKQYAFFLGGGGGGGGGEAKVDETENINFHVSSRTPFSRCLNQYPQHTASRPHCAETGLLLARLATARKAFVLYRPATGFSRIAEDANKF